ncbi:MAG: peptidylprolyl isomerase [Gammaproteobacteria bacterium]|nr:peptidylprolyl isomerase [Gammaproteobacteria bacterium]
MQVAKHKVVIIDYTLTDDQGAVIDSSKGGEPLAYIQGMNNIIPGLENALAGKQAGDALQVSIAPGEGYGERNDAMQQEVPREMFDGADEIQVGMQFHASDGEHTHVVTVVSVTETHITVDGNHPLAGQTLNFDVTIVDVRDATEEEMEHGHVHGTGGHHH